MKSNFAIDDLYYFCTVASCGSFKHAAQQLGLPLSTLSRRIQKLEQDLKIRLLNRDSHRVTLTQIGERYFQRYQTLFEELDTISEDLQVEKHQPKGKIRISAPITVGSLLLLDAFYQFLADYPDIDLDLRLSNAMIDIESEGVDVAFRVGSTIVNDWVCREIRDIRFILCCHPDYDISNIHHPADLCRHKLIVCQPVLNWELHHRISGETFDYHPSQNIRVRVDEIQMLTSAVKRNIGIAYFPDYYATPLMEQGEIKQVLPEWESFSRPLFMLYRDREHLPARVRLFVDFIKKQFEQ